MTKEKLTKDKFEKAFCELKQIIKPEELLPIPSKESVEKELKLWEEGYFKINKSKTEIEWIKSSKYKYQNSTIKNVFQHYYSHNLDNALVKVSILNDFYSTSIFDTYPLAKNISEIKDFEKRLEKGCAKLVEEITEAVSRRNYSFATKYCHHHNPKEYPIYDSHVAEALKHYISTSSGEFSFKKNEIKKYEEFRNILKIFKEKYSLTDVLFYKIDIFLWQVGKRISLAEKIEKEKTKEEKPNLSLSSN